MKHKIYIQEIEKLSGKISVYKLIYRHFKLKWWLIIFSPILFLISSYICYCYGSYCFLAIFFILSIEPLLYAIYYMDEKTKIIIQQKYPYALKEEKYAYNRVIPEIQKQEFIKLINNPKALTKDNITIIIESLKSKKDENKYPYTIIFNAIILFMSIVSVFLSRYLDFIENYEELTMQAKIILGGAITILLYVTYWDFSFINFVLNRQKKQNRLIIVLENMYLNMI